ncbi:DUF456 family protein [Actinomyces culturomici]|uniref:DUF456 family protein n=1 Tax=Actinomyces culturomici TaxID=1926276 RepID=UPI00135B98EB|nr:DUF456 family protein [Actinomyces culturomici]
MVRASGRVLPEPRGIEGTVRDGGLAIAGVAHFGEESREAPEAPSADDAIVVTGLLVLAASTALKYAIPGKRLVKSGTPNSTLLLALAVGVVGWFVVPVLGLPLGALGAVYLLERHRLGAHADAWSAILDVLKSLGLSILIEVVAALVVASLWILGLLLV